MVISTGSLSQEEVETSEIEGGMSNQLETLLFYLLDIDLYQMITSDCIQGIFLTDFDEGRVCGIKYILAIDLVLALPFKSQ